MLLVLTGPTGVGKTELSLGLAEQLGAQILSADSRQLYRQLDIGTAKPTPDDQGRAPHHLLDVIDPDQRFSAGAFGRRAREIISSLRSSDTPAFLVGGSGLYLEATIDGMGASPPVDAVLRRDLEHRWVTEGAVALHEQLMKCHPAVASRIGVQDRSRILRALELYELTGAAQIATAQYPPLVPRPLFIALNRPRRRLHARIEARIGQMLALGWLDEVRSVLDGGIRSDAPGLESLGYQQLMKHLQGQCTLADAVEEIARRTRQYAKRQITWLRRDRRYRWLDIERFGVQGCMSRIIAQWGAQR